MELEIGNVIYFGKPVTGMSLDMSCVYRGITQNPGNIKPVESTGNSGRTYPARETQIWKSTDFDPSVKSCNSLLQSCRTRLKQLIEG